MFKLFGFLFRYAPRLVIGSALVAVLNGAAATGILMFINSAVEHNGDWPLWILAGFIALSLLTPASRMASHLLLANLAQTIVYDMRAHICKHILITPLRKLEQLGSGKLLASLTSDVKAISAASTTLPFLSMQLTLMGSAFCYLTWLYWKASVAMSLAFVLGYFLLRRMNHKLDFFFGRARAVEDTLFHHFGGAINGVKEYKIYRNQRQFFLDEELPEALQASKNDTMSATTHYSFNNNLIYLLFYTCLGLLVFLLPYFDDSMSPLDLSKYVMVMLYMWASVDRLATSMNVLIPAQVAMKKVEELGARLMEMGSGREDLGRQPSPDWKSVALVGVTHSYHREKEDETFTLGPIDIHFLPKQITFIVGGNGSGKTTLAKLIVGLYEPEAGAVRVDDQDVDGTNRDHYRQLFSAVFSDFYLFDNIKGLHIEAMEDQALAYLEKLHLNHKVKVKDGRISTTALSQGQRKRLALLTAYLQDRPIYLFDEWAADQDPLFKRIFYENLLPELKSRGKTVIAITHDDHFFHMADRIIKIDNGTVEYDKPCLS